MKVLFVSINAKNIHKALAPYCLSSAVSTIQGVDCDVIESNINVPIYNIASQLLQCNADMVGFCCYIWNIDYVTKLVALLRQHNSDIKIVLGGPEIVSTDNYIGVDTVVVGNGEEAIKDIVNMLLAGQPLPKCIIAQANFAQQASPLTEQYFQSFARDDIAIGDNRLVYYESSRGCPFCCAYCISSIDNKVQFLPIQQVQQDLNMLVDKGAKIIKFVDRTFNANPQRARQILDIISQLSDDVTFHMEIAAHLIDEPTIQLLSTFARGKLQFEIGIQSINRDTLQAIDRAGDIAVVLANIKKLSQLGNVKVHADLIAGLPFDTLETFEQAIEHALWAAPHVLNIGFLKVLKGTKIAAMADSFCQYMPFAPYQVIQTNTVTHSQLQLIQRYDDIVDKYYNSGKFCNCIELAYQHFGSYIAWLCSFAQYIGNSNIKVSLKNSYTIIFNHLCQHIDQDKVAHAVKLDCLSSDSKGMLPDAIQQHRCKQLEKHYHNKQIRVEYFAYDNSTRLFDYSTKDKVTNRYSCTVVSQ